MNALGMLFSGLEARDIKTSQVIVFDWFDGPRAGVAKFSLPPCEVEFKVRREYHCAEDLDDRLYELATLPPGSIGAILNALSILGTPSETLWIPIWNFPDDRVRRDIESTIDRVLSLAKPSQVFLQSKDFQRIDEIVINSDT